MEEYENNEDIRSPDHAFFDQLIDSSDAALNNPEEEEWKMAMKISREEYLKKQEDLCFEQYLEEMIRENAEKEIERRKESFKNFISKTERIAMMENNEFLKKIVLEPLYEYIDLKCDDILLEDNNYQQFLSYMKSLRMNQEERDHLLSVFNNFRQ